MANASAAKTGSPKRVTVKAKSHIAVWGCATELNVVVVFADVVDVDSHPQ